jgi:glycosyltransferase involved in cell wall biosynthesis
VYFVSHSTADDHLGGSELSILHVIDSWQRSNPALVPVLVAPSMRSALAVEARRRGWECLVYPYEGWALPYDPGGGPEATLRARRDFSATRNLIEQLRRARPALVVTNTLVAPWGAYAAAAVGAPHVWFVREFPDAAHGLHFPVGRENALRDIGMLSHAVIANSLALRDALLPFIPAEKLEVAHPAVFADRIRALADEPLPLEPFPLPEAALRVTVVGRITRTKGQWRVIEAIARLRERGVRIAVCFVGAQVERDGVAILSQRARRLGVGDAVVFAGERHNPFPFVRAADVGVTPSDREAFGRTTFEYLLLGKPVVASATGGSVELVVDGESGYLVEPDDIGAWAARLERLAEDPELLEVLSAGAAMRAEALVAANSPSNVVSLLQEATLAPGYRLPATVVGWLDAPAAYPTASVTVLSSFARLRNTGRRLRRMLGDPVGTVRRAQIRLLRRPPAPAAPPVAGDAPNHLPSAT